MKDKEQTISNLRKLKSFHNGSYGADIDKAIKALEQEPKSEWQHDHEILKAYSDGANEVLDKIRAEIMQLDYNLESVEYDHNDMAMTEEVHMICQEEVLQIIDKYKTGEGLR